MWCVQKIELNVRFHDSTLLLIRQLLIVNSKHPELTPIKFIFTVIFRTWSKAPLVFLLAHYYGHFFERIQFRLFWSTRPYVPNAFIAVILFLSRTLAGCGPKTYRLNGLTFGSNDKQPIRNGISNQNDVSRKILNT